MGQEKVAPLFEQRFPELLETCVRLASEDEANAVRVIVILGVEDVAVVIDPAGSAEISNCVAEELRKWQWPIPPRVMYMPLELNTRPPDPEEQGRDADRILRSIRPSNKSPEQAR